MQVLLLLSMNILKFQSHYYLKLDMQTTVTDSSFLRLIGPCLFDPSLEEEDATEEEGAAKEECVTGEEGAPEEGAPKEEDDAEEKMRLRKKVLLTVVESSVA